MLQKPHRKQASKHTFMYSDTNILHFIHTPSWQKIVINIWQHMKQLHVSILTLKLWQYWIYKIISIGQLLKDKKHTKVKDTQ